MYVFGGLSAQVAALFTNPIDVVKIRLQLQGEGKCSLISKQSKKGIGRMFVSIIHEEGVLALWKGVVPSLLREITYSSIRLGAYEPVRNLLSTSMGGNSHEAKDISLWTKLFAGAVSGAVGSGLANPIDLVKVQQQAMTGFNPKINNYRTFNMLHEIYQEQGVRGLFRGVVPTIKRAALLTATQLGTYDHIKQFLLRSSYFDEGISLHFSSGSIAGLVLCITNAEYCDMLTLLHP